MKYNSLKIRLINKVLCLGLFFNRRAVIYTTYYVAAKTEVSASRVPSYEWRVADNAVLNMPVLPINEAKVLE